MANVKISELPAADTLDGTETLPAVQGTDTVQVTVDDLRGDPVAPAGGWVADDIDDEAITEAKLHPDVAAQLGAAEVPPGGWTTTDIAPEAITEARLHPDVVAQLGLTVAEVISHGSAGASETVTASNDDFHTMTLDSASCAVTFAYDGPSGDAAFFTVAFVQDATGGRTVTFPNVASWIGHGSAATLAMGPGQTTYLDFFTPDGGTTFYGVSTASLGDAYKVSGALYETFSRQGRALQNVNVLSSGRLSLTAIDIPAGVRISSITFVSGSTGATTPTGQWFELRDSSRNLLRKTVDDTTTAWASATPKTLALASPFTTTYGGLHYLGLCVVAATPPSLKGAAGDGTVLGIAPILNGNADTGLTYATTPATAAAITAQNNEPWAYVS